MEHSRNPMTLQVNGMFATLDLMKAAGVNPSSDSYVHLSNALVRSVDFVVGAVDMTSLPQRKLREAVRRR
jgi:hypothetical protein